MARVWSCSGLRWSADGPVLMWDGGRGSALSWGKRVAFAVAEGGVRTCTGARGHACPRRAAVPGRSTGARCEECARLDRAHSVAADTLADDPRPYRVYLAWFGPGMVKVGITAVERGEARLLEQGAVCFGWLGVGPLMAARRAEELLRAALGVPDRIPYADKRAVRARLPTSEAERAAELAELHARAVALPGWPESLTREPFRAVDHVRAFGLAGAPGPVGEVRELVPGGVVSGELVAAAGPDLHLAAGPVAGRAAGLPAGSAAGPSAGPGAAPGTGAAVDPATAATTGATIGVTTGRGVGAGAVVVLDTRLMTGWELTAAEGDLVGGVTVPVREFRETGHAQEGLF